jgi:aspartyl protease family protein
MRQLMTFAVVLVVLGGAAARYADQAASSPPPQAAVVQPAYEPREPATSGRSLTLEADRLGHFQVEARIDGRSVDFIIDTGASLIVLRKRMPCGSGFARGRAATAITANGKIKAARATINTASSSARLPSMRYPPWCFPTRRSQKTCSAFPFYRGSAATNMLIDI